MSKFKKLLGLIMATLLLILPATNIFGYSYGSYETYNYENISYNRDRFTNKVDGYSIDVPTGMTVDMSKSEVMSSLANQELKIEVYRQSIASGSSAQSYITYGNKFIGNTVDHKKEYSQVTTINGRKATILQWSREKLAKVPNDKNNYATVDIVAGNEVYTLFFKSTMPLYAVIDYMEVARSFKTLEKTASPMIFKTKTIENSVWNEKTKSFYEEHFLNSTKLEWGIFEPYFPSTDKLKNIEKQIDHSLNYVVLYTHIKDNDLTHIQTALNVAKAENRTIELTLQTRPAGSGEKNAVYGVLNGEYDSYLETYAAQIASYGEPILFRLGNEMNGDWCAYSSYNTSKDTDMYKAMYKYIYNKFEQAGANANTIWVWNPNGKSFPNFDWNNELMYYPGDEYVNVVGMTAYNTGTYYSAEKWTSFSELYSNMYNNYVSRYTQPLMITEFASSSVGGDKVQWVKEMFDTLPNFPEIKVAIWWNGADYNSAGKIARPYFIDDIPAVLEVFKQRLN